MKHLKTLNGVRYTLAIATCLITHGKFFEIITEGYKDRYVTNFEVSYHSRIRFPGGY